MMNYRFTFKNTRPKSSTTKHTFHFALFVAFTLWLLYEIGQSYSKSSVIDETFPIHLNQEQIFYMFGRKGRVKPLDSTNRVDSNTNPGEVKEMDFGIMENNGGNDEKELTFDGVKEQQESVSTTMLTMMKSNNPDLITHSFSDENGIPELDRNKFESTQSGNETHVRVRSAITT